MPRSTAIATLPNSVLFCSNNVTLEAKTETNDLHEAIDLTIAKIERQMREQKAKIVDRSTEPLNILQDAGFLSNFV